MIIKSYLNMKIKFIMKILYLIIINSEKFKAYLIFKLILVS